MKKELLPIFERFSHTATVNVYIDDSPISKEVKGFVTEMEQLTSKLQFRYRK